MLRTLGGAQQGKWRIFNKTRSINLFSAVNSALNRFPDKPKPSSVNLIPTRWCKCCSCVFVQLRHLFSVSLESCVTRLSSIYPQMLSVCNRNVPAHPAFYWFPFRRWSWPSLASRVNPAVACQCDQAYWPASARYLPAGFGVDSRRIEFKSWPRSVVIHALISIPRRPAECLPGTFRLTAICRLFICSLAPTRLPPRPGLLAASPPTVTE